MSTLNATARNKLTEAATLLSICSAESQWLESAEKRIEALLHDRQQMRGDRPASAKELLREADIFLSTAEAILPFNQLVLDVRRLVGDAAASMDGRTHGASPQMRKFLTPDQFRRTARRNERLPRTTMLQRDGAGLASVVRDRTFRFVFSDGAVDRAGDRIDPSGWDTNAFMKNPVILWSHNATIPPIGRARSAFVSGDKLLGDIEFAGADANPFAETIFRAVKDGFIKAVSVGFRPIEWAFVSDKNRPSGIDFKKQELLEVSVCAVPCNAGALLDA